jgi:hypothetical protein
VFNVFKGLISRSRKRGPTRSQLEGVHWQCNLKVIGVQVCVLLSDSESFQVRATGPGMIIFKLFDLLVILPWPGPGTCVHVLRPGRQFYRLGSALAFSKRLFAIDTFVNERKLGTIRSLARYPSHCDSTWSCQWSFKAVAMMFKLFISKSSKAVPPASWPELLPGLASRWSAIVNSAVSSSVRSIVGPGITTLICSPLSESSESLIHSRGQSMMMSEMTLAASCFP